MQDIVYPKVGFIQRYKKTHLLPPLPQKNLCCINETIKNKSPDLRVIRQILHLVSQFLWLSRIKSEFKSQIAIKIQFKSAYCIQFDVFYRKDQLKESKFCFKNFECFKANAEYPITVVCKIV